MRLFFILAAMLLAVPSVARAQDLTAYLAQLTTHIVEHQKYPSSASLYGIEGDAIVSIQVDKKGNIVHYRFVRDTDQPVLHKGVVEILEDATPVPVPPEAYFRGQELAEFMFPVAFRIGMKPESLVAIDREFQETILKLSQ